MTKNIELKINFSRRLNEEEQNTFWDNLVYEIEKLNGYAGGGHDGYGLNWGIDCSNSPKEVAEIKRRLSIYLNEQEQIISKYIIKPT